MKIRGNDFLKVDILPKESTEEEKGMYFIKSVGFPRNSSVVNLGIYYDIVEQAYRAERFVGVMPLAKWSDFGEKSGWVKPSISNGNVIIGSRFGDPLKMLQTVLESKERYDDVVNKMLTPMIDTWENWSKANITKKNAHILYGIIRDIPEIKLSNESGNDSEKVRFLSNINNIFEVSDYLNKLKKVCRTVIKKESIRCEENLVGKVKGRINIPKQIKHNLAHGRVDRNYCIYNKMDIDTRENRILKYALHLCKKWSAQSGDLFAEDISFCSKELRDIKLIKCGKRDAFGIKNNGAYKQYKEAMEAAIRIFERMNVVFNEKKGVSEIKVNQKVTPFFIRIDLLFELYCRAVVEKALEEQAFKNYKLVPYARSSVTVFNKNESIPEGFQNDNVPDILITCDNKNLIVMDAKYMPLDKKQDFMVRENTHQILAYMLITDAKYGGFIYPGKSTPNNKGVDSSKALDDVTALIPMTNKSKYGYSIGLPMKDNDYENIKRLLISVIDREKNKSKDNNEKGSNK